MRNTIPGNPPVPPALPRQRKRNRLLPRFVPIVALSLALGAAGLAGFGGLRAHSAAAFFTGSSLDLSGIPLPNNSGNLFTYLGYVTYSAPTAPGVVAVTPLDWKVGGKASAGAHTFKFVDSAGPAASGQPLIICFRGCQTFSFGADGTVTVRQDVMTGLFSVVTS